MKYVLLMYADPVQTSAMSAADREAMASKHRNLRGDLTVSGELVNGAGLAYPGNTTTLRFSPDDPTTTGGPVIEADVHLTAYYVVDCETRERALSIARRKLDYHVTAVEVREVHDSIGLDRLK